MLHVSQKRAQAVALTALMVARSRRPPCADCTSWPPLSVLHRDLDGVHQVWMDVDGGPAAPCSMCGRRPVVVTVRYTAPGEIVRSDLDLGGHTAEQLACELVPRWLGSGPPQLPPDLDE
jgi:hypothetical protein